MLAELDASLVTVTSDVFQTMVGWNVRPSEDGPGDCKPGPFELAEINGCIGFAGKVVGNLFFCSGSALGGRIGRAILGQECSLTETSDVIGELTNMLAGGVKTRLCDRGHTTVISIPNVIRGAAIRAAGRDIEFMIRRRFQVPEAGSDFQIVIQGKQAA